MSCEYEPPSPFQTPSCGSMLMVCLMLLLLPVAAQAVDHSGFYSGDIVDGFSMKMSEVFMLAALLGVLVLGYALIFILFFRCRRAARLMQSNERRFRAIFEQAFQFIGLLTYDGRILEANPASLAFTGAKVMDVQGLYLWDGPWWRHDAAERERVRRAVEAAARGVSIRFETTHISRDGKLRYFDFSLTPCRDSKGEVAFIIPEGRDCTQARQAQIDLKQQQERYRILFDDAGDAIAIFENNRVVECNNKALELYRCTWEEMRLMGPGSMSSERQPDGSLSSEAAAAHMAAAMTGAPHRFEWRQKRMDGSVFYADICLVTVHQDGETLVQAIIRDITEQKSAAEECKETAKLLSLSEEIGEIGSFVYDRNTGDVRWSPQLYRLFGLEPCGPPPGIYAFAGLMVGNEWRFMLEALEDAWTIGDRREADYWIRRANDGAIRYMHTIGLWDRDDEHGVAILRGAVQDCTETYLAQVALKVNEERFAVAMEAANDGLWDWNIATGQAYYSPVYFTMLGYEPGAFPSIYDSWRRLLHPDDLPRALDVIAAHAQSRIAFFETEFRMLTMSGDYKWILSRGKVIERDGNGCARRMVGTHMDITSKKENDLARKHAEEALRINEERLALALDAANDGLWDWDLVTGEVYFSPVYYTMLGYEPDEFPASIEAWNSLLHPDDIEAATWEINMHIERDIGGFDIEFRMRAKSGEWRWIMGRGKTVVRDVSGRAVRMLGTHTDISERKAAQEEREAIQRQIADERNLLLTLLENIPCQVFVKDRQSRFIMHNRSTGLRAHQTKAPRRDLIGKTDFDFIEYERALPYFEEEQRLMESGDSIIEQEVKVDHGNGDFQWYLTSKIPLRDANGVVTGLVGINQFITELKLAEQEIRYTRNYLRNIIDSMPSILAGVDTTGHITHWNKQAELASGITAVDACGRLFTEALPAFSAEMSRINEAIATRQILHRAKVTCQIGGENRYVDMTIYPLVANGVEGAVIRMDDVTNRVKMEEIVVQTEKIMSVGGLAAGMAHEINNPLAGMLQNAQVLQSRLSPGLAHNVEAAAQAGVTMEAIQAYAETRGVFRIIQAILDSGERVAVIVQNVLSFSRKYSDMTSTHDLADLLDRTVELAKSDYDLKKKYDFRQINIIREYDSSATCVCCEGTKLQQVFFNILRNGAEAMAENASAMVSAQFILRVLPEEGMVRVEIEDNGPGMSEEVRRRVFEPFYTTKGVGLGTGLGLSVSYFIITENHGGILEVESTPGHGARFIIRIPVRKEEESVKKQG